jgi:hypothetical protein
VFRDVTRGDWLILGAIIAIEVLWPQTAWTLRRMQYRHTFELRLSGGPAISPVGLVRVSLIIHHTTVLTGFNVRFVQERKLRRPLPVDPNVIRIDKVQLTRPETLSVIPDGDGGQDCEFTTGHHNQSPRQIQAGKALEFDITVSAASDCNWRGSLSVEALDADGRKQYARHPFSVPAGA